MSADDLDRGFAELLASIDGYEPLSATHVAPFHFWVHEPSDTVELHRRLPRYLARLDDAGFSVTRVSLAKLLWQVVDASGRDEDWLEDAANRPAASVMRYVPDGLRDDLRARTKPGLAESLAPYVADTTPGRLVLVTDAALVHPWFRIRTLESHLHDRVRCPTVVLYPGRRVGQHALQFLDLYAEDPNYRSSAVGGHS